MLIAALLVGASTPGGVVKHLLPIAAFLLITGSFLAAGFAPAENKRGGKGKLLFAFCWLSLLSPAVLFALLHLVEIDPALSSGIMLAAIAPPIGSAAAIATMLDLRPRLALILSIGLTVAAPVVMPAYLAFLGATVSAGFAQVAMTSLLIVGAALVIALLARRYRAVIAAALPDGYAASGISVIGLFIVGLTAAASVRGHFIADPTTCLTTLSMAFALNLGSCAAGALAFASWGLRDALTVGLVSGNRNVTLAWAIAYGSIPAEAEAFVTAAVVPVLALPLLLTLGMKLRAARAGRRLDADRAGAGGARSR